MLTTRAMGLYFTAVYPGLGHFRNHTPVNGVPEPFAFDFRIPLGNGLVHNYGKQAR